MNRCSQCHLEKAPEEFCASRRWCKTCSRAYHRANYKINRERIIARKTVFYHKTKVLTGRRNIATTFDDSYIPVTESGCWIWEKFCYPNGYGLANFGDKKGFAHRFSWTRHFGEIPKGKIVCHKCDIPACVNPDHLFLGTHQDNIQDKLRKGRQSRKLSAQDVKEIRLANGPAPEVAKKYGVSSTHILKIWAGKKFHYEGVL